MTAARTPRIDYCSWCRGLRDVPIDFGMADVRDVVLEWVEAERMGECASCGEPVRPGDRVAWSSIHQGSVGKKCCEEAA